MKLLVDTTSRYPGFIVLAFFWAVFNGPAVAGTNDGRVIITAKEIAQSKAVKMADVLNRVPGVKAGDTSVSIHGSSKVKVLVDSRPMNDPTSSMGGIRWDMVPLETVDKIEILKGKGSLEYGDDAAGGVILVTTRKVSDFSGNIKVYGGNRGTWETGANCRAGLGRFGISASGSLYSTDGYTFNNDKDQKRAGIKIDYTPGENSGLMVSANHLDEEKGMSGRPDYPTPHSRQTSYMDSFSLSGRFGALTSNTYFNEGEKHNTDISKSLDNTLLIRQAGVDASTGFNFDKKGTLACGAAANWGEASGTTLSQKEETGASVFGSYAYKMAILPLTLTAGLRGNAYSDFSNSLNPEIKAALHKGEIEVTAGYNRANNTPSFYQRYNRTSTTLINPDLDMETSDNYSLCVSGKVTAFLSAGATVFYNKLEDRITYVRSQAGTGQYQNIGEATYKGFDLSTDWKIHEKLSITAAYTFLEAIDETTDLRLTAKARHKGSAELSVSPFKNLTLVAGIDASSYAYTRSDNSQKVPGYVLYNLRGEYELKKLTVFTEIKNMTDTTYYYVDGTFAPPRKWILGINLRF